MDILPPQAPPPGSGTAGITPLRRPDGPARGDGNRGGAPLAALTSAAALPIDLATLPFRMADVGLTAAVRLLEAVAPTARPEPESK